ncbi:MAG TPA: anaerobic ribonucleoside-triphosphate reductase activating protein [Candidatus Nanoarchaeia archaeon]|nr:anaerobic ribonucleoside-triphosphate reductase activating protein [Candidatus Nanoarchaeia archaeon]
MQAFISDISKSSVDWDNKDSIIVYFAGCDFRCPYCFAAEILDTKQEFLKYLKEVKSQIKELSYHCSAIYFTGGEPCLQKPALIELARFSRSLGLKTGLQTNGSNPNVLRLMLDLNLLNYVSLDLKAPFDDGIFEKTTKSSTFFKPTSDIMDEVKESISILKENKKINIDVRTTITPSIMFNKEHILRVASEIKGTRCRWILQQFQPNLGKLVNGNMKDINPPSFSFLENLKEACLKVYPEMRIEIKDGSFNVADLAKLQSPH